MDILKVSTFHYPPFISIDQSGSKLAYSGIEVNLVRTTAALLGLNIVFSTPSDGGKWGDVLPNGSAHGLIKDIVDARADVGIAQMFNLAPKNQFIQPSYPYDLDGYCFIVQNKKPRPKFLAFMGPYEIVSWVLVIVSLAVTSLAFSLATKKNILGVLLKLFGAMLGQGTEIKRQKGCARI